MDLERYVALGLGVVCGTPLQISFDPVSLAFIKDNLTPKNVPSALLRQQLWRDLYDMTRYAACVACRHCLSAVVFWYQSIAPDVR